MLIGTKLYRLQIWEALEWRHCQKNGSCINSVLHVISLWPSGHVCCPGSMVQLNLLHFSFMSRSAFQGFTDAKSCAGQYRCAGQILVHQAQELHKQTQAAMYFLYCAIACHLHQDRGAGIKDTATRRAGTCFAVWCNGTGAEWRRGEGVRMDCVWKEGEQTQMPWRPFKRQENAGMG